MGEGRERSLANLDPQGALTHQVRRFRDRGLFPCCDKCVGREACDAFEAGSTCKPAERFRDEIVGEVMALRHILPTDAPLVCEYANLLTATKILDLYLGRAGLFLPGAESYVELQPGFVKSRLALTNSLTRLAAELGLTPMSRARLGGDPDRGPAAELARAIKQLAAEKPADPTPIDAEFTARDEGGIESGE